MTRLYVILAIVLFAFTVYTLIDCARTSRLGIRALPKPLWMALILVITPIGGILWYLLGKDRYSRATGSGARSGPRAPDDDPEFLAGLAEQKKRAEQNKSDDQNPPQV